MNTLDMMLVLDNSQASGETPLKLWFITLYPVLVGLRELQACLWWPARP
jgi:hypothetical protein